MFAAVLVMFFGAGVCALGAIQDDMYFVGAVFWFIGLIGLLVWAGDRAGALLRWLRL
jgi:hypothetical protein